MKENYIYVINEAETNNIKVGISSNPELRLKDLQTGNPRKLTLLHKFEGSHRNEADIHKKLKKYNLSGEWFSPPEGFIDSLGELEEVERKHMKMLSIRMNPKKFIRFKDFCARNRLTMKDAITIFVDLTLEAEQYERESKNDQD